MSPDPRDAMQAGVEAALAESRSQATAAAADAAAARAARDALHADVTAAAETRAELAAVRRDHEVTASALENARAAVAALEAANADLQVCTPSSLNCESWPSRLRCRVFAVNTPSPRA